MEKLQKKNLKKQKKLLNLKYLKLNFRKLFFKHTSSFVLDPRVHHVPN